MSKSYLSYQIYSPLTLGVLVLTLLVSILGWSDVLELRAEEPRRALVSLEMMMSQQYWRPEINGWAYYNKPPLFNWYMILFFKIMGGASDWVVRLPGILAYLFTASATYLWCKRYYNRHVAVLASLFFLYSADLLFYGVVNSGEIDLFFTALVFLQIASIFHFSRNEKWLSMFILSYFFAALGTLTKGPPSIAFQSCTLVPWLVYQRKWKCLLGLQHIAGILTFTLIVGGYFYRYSLSDDAIGFMMRLVKESSQRTGLETKVIDTILQSVAFPFYILQLLLPWSIFLFYVFRKGNWNQIKTHPVVIFCLIFILFNIPIYWLTGDPKARYLYPFFPFISILMAHLYVSRYRHKSRVMNAFNIVIYTAMVLVLMASVALPFIPDLHMVSYLPAIAILGGLSVGLCIWTFHKFTNSRILIICAFMLIVRIIFNMTYLPATVDQSRKMKNHMHVDNILHHTGEEAVHLAGTPYQFSADVSIGPLQISETRLTTAPILNYNIPFYLSRANGHIMRFDTSLLAQHYYLGIESQLDRDIEHRLYEFEDHWTGQTLVLFRTDALGNY